ncbi:uncharacterized protein LOC143257924 isoform X4 [Tachypleus tridentatus]|uniref:uncharacterized protein LOC143257924 isoform X4 n=1 Tax=Tachypleus tridentatus TaxID=6853 RepID=UPI003FD0DE41
MVSICSYVSPEMCSDFRIQSLPVGVFLDCSASRSFQTATFTCEVCNKTFTRRSDMKRHKNNHSRVRMHFYCHVCSKFFMWKRTLRRHVKFHCQNP